MSPNPYRNPADVVRETTQDQADIHEEHRERAAEMKAAQEARFHEETAEELPDEDEAQ